MMGNHMFNDKPVKETCTSNGYCCHLQYGSSIMQGWRRKQEDAMAMNLPFFKDFSFFGVYDGHGGPEVAVYLKNKFDKVLKSYLKTESPEIALQCAFNFIDLYLRSHKGRKQLDKILEQLEGKTSVMSQQSKFSRFLASINAKYTDVPIEETDSSSSNESEENDSRGITSTSNNNSEKGQPSKFDALNYLVHEDLAASDSEDGSYLDSPESINSLNAAEAKNGPDSPVPSEPGKDGQNENETQVNSEFNEENEAEENVSSSRASLEHGPNGNNINEMETESENSGDAQPNNPVNLFEVESGVDSGSTVTVVLVNPFKMFLANIGDSRCIISKLGRAIDVSVDHNPDSQEELSRIENAACRVTDGRIEGVLNLSRAIGDFRFKKKFGLPLSQQSISPEPYVASVDIDDAVDFIVLATDGIWNSLSSQEVCDFINMRMSDANVKISDICDELCHHCLESYDESDGTGMDNMSIIIICPHTSKYAKELMKQTKLLTDEDDTCCHICSDESGSDESGSDESSSDEDNIDGSDAFDVISISTSSSDESTSCKRKPEIPYNAAKRFKSNTGS